MKFHEIAMFTDQVDALSDFYERLFDVKPAYRGPGISIFKIGDTQILLHVKYEPKPGELPCENHIAFAVNNLDQAVDALQGRDISIETAPKTYDWGRSAYLRDPEGHLIELHESIQR